jgi:pyrroloquinoline-quinone synthase
MAKVWDRELRREWIRRIYNHDGYGSEAGGIERWLKLTDGLKLDRLYVTSQTGALPATKFAVKAYVHFVYEHPTLEAIASSLAELFAPGIHAERIVGMLEHYDFISEELVAYFRRRLDQAPRDSQFALTFVLENARTCQQQQAVLNALKFKTDVLWAQLDALYFAYVDPGFIPPGAFRPE